MLYGFGRDPSKLWSESGVAMRSDDLMLYGFGRDPSKLWSESGVAMRSDDLNGHTGLQLAAHVNTEGRNPLARIYWRCPNPLVT